MSDSYKESENVQRRPKQVGEEAGIAEKFQYEEAAEAI
jgi:hypothetical protein